MEFFINLNQFSDLLGSAIRLGTPIAFAALGGVISEKSGMINVGLEGMMLSGALGAAIGSYYTGSAVLGVFGALFAGSLFGWLLGILTVNFRVNQLVAGIAINLLCAGLTAFIARQVFGQGLGQTFVRGFDAVTIPYFTDLPIIGTHIFKQDPIALSLLVLAPLATWTLFRTHWGLSLRATGENPKAADAGGVPVLKIRKLAILVSSWCAALGGAHLVLSQLHLFTDGMSASRGYIALAAIILGRWNPLLAIAAAFFFGLCDAAQLTLQFSSPNIPYQAFVILPYVASVIALVLLVGGRTQPSALGLSYDREAR